MATTASYLAEKVYYKNPADEGHLLRVARILSEEWGRKNVLVRLPIEWHRDNEAPIPQFVCDQILPRVVIEVNDGQPRISYVLELARV